MSAMPPSFPGIQDAGRLLDGEDAAASRWAVLAEAGALVASLACLESEEGVDQREFQALIRDAEPWRRELALHGVDDLVAIMEPGIAALLAVRTRGADPRPAAQALWREYRTARDAVLSLLQPVAA